MSDFADKLAGDIWAYYVGHDSLNSYDEGGAAQLIRERTVDRRGGSMTDLQWANRLATEAVEMGGNELTDSQHASLVAEVTAIIASRTVDRETHEALASVHSETVKVLARRLVELAELRAKSVPEPVHG